ncbi:MAG: hypothetical protein ABI673_10650 [Novosphingobium sp.]
MIELIQANRLAFALALLIGLLVAWWIFRSGKQGPRREWRPDVLDEGAAPAQRNQALIDAPVASSVLDVVPDVVLTDAVRSPVPAGNTGDDLTRIKGLGPKLAALLGSLGVNSFDQIATWSDEDVARIDAQLGSFAGRPVRDAWVEQAKLLATGDTGGFESKFGKI